MVYKAQSGHPGGSLSCIDILVGLYRSAMRFDPKNPGWEDRDRFVMSKGHASPAVYSILRDVGVLEDSDLDGFRSLGSVCQGHVDRKWTEGVDFSAGSLGMGLSFGLGSALAARLDVSERHTWVLLGDGEIQEGQIWEALQVSVYYKLDNLWAIVDVNEQQVDGAMSDVLDIGNIQKKINSFGAKCIEIDGHDIEAMRQAKKEKHKDQPLIILARTSPYKGMEYLKKRFPRLHYVRFKSEEERNKMNIEISKELGIEPIEY